MNQFAIFSQEIVHGITTRENGVSQSPYDMNTGFYGADDFNDVCRNIFNALQSMGASAKTIIATRQTHSDHVLIIDSAFDFDKLEAVDVTDTALSDYQLYVADDVDALITNREDIILMTFHADCVPILLASTSPYVVAAVHSGWRGTAKQIVKEVLYLMQEKLEVPLETIKVAIGQSAGSCCYEVEYPVIEALQKRYTKAMLTDNVIPKDYGKYLIDLKGINKTLLIHEGILESHIEVNPDCTICLSDKYHSYRASGTHRGSMSAFIQIKKHL